MKNCSIFPLQDRLALEALMQAHKPGDYLMLSDRVLLAALAGDRALRQSEWLALLNSPVTLRRMRVLEAQRQRAAAASSPQVAANDAQWYASPTLLRAASSGSAGFSQSSDDGRWELHVIGTGADARLVLKLNPDAPHAETLLLARPEVAVLDGESRTLLMGPLDEYGELEGSWILPGDLRSHLVAHGGCWTVERV